MLAFRDNRASLIIFSAHQNQMEKWDTKGADWRKKHDQQTSDKIMWYALTSDGYLMEVQDHAKRYRNTIPSSLDPVGFSFINQQANLIISIDERKGTINRHTKLEVGQDVKMLHALNFSELTIPIFNINHGKGLSGKAQDPKTLS